MHFLWINSSKTLSTGATKPYHVHSHTSESRFMCQGCACYPSHWHNYQQPLWMNAVASFTAMKHQILRSLGNLLHGTRSPSWTNSTQPASWVASWPKWDCANQTCKHLRSPACKHHQTVHVGQHTSLLVAEPREQSHVGLRVDPQNMLTPWPRILKY